MVNNKVGVPESQLRTAPTAHLCKPINKEMPTLTHHTYASPPASLPICGQAHDKPQGPNQHHPDGRHHAAADPTLMHHTSDPPSASYPYVARPTTSPKAPMRTTQMGATTLRLRCPVWTTSQMAARGPDM